MITLTAGMTSHASRREIKIQIFREVGTVVPCRVIRFTITLSSSLSTACVSLTVTLPQKAILTATVALGAGRYDALSVVLRSWSGKSTMLLALHESAVG